MQCATQAMILAFVLLTAIRPSAAFDTGRIEDPEVRRCADRALPSRTARQLQKVDVVGKDGYVRESRREMFWRRSEDNNDSRVLVRVVEPLDDHGLAVLIIDDADRSAVSYMSYSPKLKRVRRVTGKAFFGSILGTDFTYEDFSYFYRADEREEVERVDDAVLDDFPAYVLETIKLDEDTHYQKVRFFIDMAVCLPMRTEFIAPNGELRKELTVDRDAIEMVDNHWVPFRTTMIDHKLGTSTVFTVEEVSIDPDLDPGLFEPQALRVGNR